ncbi:MAG: hypothetical protein FJ112_04970 [Deltaproteobacteria bacterium]|nr:hypothetical protein [Deltaproteobacteria bacterium]
MNTAELLNDHFRFEVSTAENRSHIKLIGIIDENADFSSLLKLKGQNISFDFKDVSSINSCGIRTWVNFMKELTGTPIEFVECPPLVVRQMNMVPSFLGSAVVTSVYIPYVCDECDHEQQQKISIQDYKSGLKIAQTITCEKCSSNTMELDGNVKQYFAFVK